MADIKGVLSRSAVSTGGMVAQGLARFLYTLAVGRAIGPEALADVSTLLSLAVYASLFWPAASGVAASHFYPQASTREQSVLVLKRSFVVSTLLLTVLSCLLTSWTAPGDFFLLVSCALLVPSYAGYVFTRGILLGKDQILRATVLDTATAFLSIAALALVLLAGYTPALLLPVVAAYALFAVLAWPRGARVRIESQQKLSVLRYTRTTAIVLISTGGLLPAAMLLVNLTEPAHVAGLFAAGISLATPASLVSQAVNQILIPQFSSMHAESPLRVQQLHRRLFLLTGLGFFIVFGAIILLAPWILSTFYGPEYASGALAMQLLLIGVFLMSLIAAPSAYLMAMGHHQISARIWVVSFLLGSISMIVCGLLWGQYGVLTGYLLGTAVGTLSVCWLALRRAPVSVTATSDD